MGCCECSHKVNYRKAQSIEDAAFYYGTSELFVKDWLGKKGFLKENAVFLFDWKGSSFSLPSFCPGTATSAAETFLSL